MGRLSIAALAVALVACDKGADPSAPRDYTDEEIAELKSRLMARLTANQQRHCIRPVLSGTPLPGSAMNAQLALLEPTGATNACLDKARDARDNLRVRERVHTAPAFIKVDDECGALIEALVREAIAHEDACAPYVAGVRVRPDESGALDTALTTISIAAVLATRASRQAPVAGLELVATAVRWNNDLMRGHATVLQAMSGSRALWDVAWDHVRAISVELADDVVPPFDALIATSPRFGAVLQGDHELSALHRALTALESPEWVPPGGTSAEFPRLVRSRNESAQGLEYYEQMLAYSTKHCGERASLASCYRNYVSHALEFPSTYPVFTEFIQVHATGVARLVALRIALEARRDGRCPTAEELDSPRYRELRAPPVLGDMVRTTLANNTLTIQPPLWAMTARFAKEPPWSVACP